MGKTFNHVVLCSTNDFHPTKNDKIKGWIEHNGGTFTKELTAEVTHLIASVKAWKRYLPIVREARRQKTVKIVKLDWLEDSLLQPSRRPLDTLKYEFECRSLKRYCHKKPSRKQSSKLSSDWPSSTEELQVKESRSDTIAKAGREFDKACDDFVKEVKAAGFHPYTDSAQFIYMISLVREDVLENRLEKHRLKLFESDATPHTYACYTMYSKPSQRPEKVELAPPGGTWDFAWDTFQKFFKTRCGVGWDARRARRADKTDGANNQFTYQSPLERELKGQRNGDGRPSVTMVLNEVDGEQDTDVRAMTPKGGW